MSEKSTDERFGALSTTDEDRHEKTFDQDERGQRIDESRRC